MIGFVVALRELGRDQSTGAKRARLAEAAGNAPQVAFLQCPVTETVPIEFLYKRAASTVRAAGAAELEKGSV